MASEMLGDAIGWKAYRAPAGLAGGPVVTRG
jgi:hypothetical protein